MELQPPHQIKISDFNEIPKKRNFFFFFLVLFVNIFYLYAFPFLLQNNRSILWLGIGYLFIIPIHGSLIHEAIHGMLFTNRTMNSFCGRTLSAFFGVAFDKNVIGHILHHQLNRTELYCEEVYNAKETSKTKGLLKYYYNEFFGLYFNDFIYSLILCFLPKKAILYIRRKTNIDNLYSLIHENKKYVRLEGLFNIFLLTSSLYVYGELYWVILVLIILKSFIFSTSAGLGHFDTPLNDIYFAHNISLPNFISRHIFMHFNYHGIHHAFPTLPWNLLPQKMIDLTNRHKIGNFHISFLGAVWQKLKPPVGLSNFPSEIQQFEQRLQKPYIKNNRIAV